MKLARFDTKFRVWFIQNALYGFVANKAARLQKASEYIAQATALVAVHQLLVDGLGAFCQNVQIAFHLPCRAADEQAINVGALDQLFAVVRSDRATV